MQPRPRSGGGSARQALERAARVRRSRSAVFTTSSSSRRRVRAPAAYDVVCCERCAWSTPRPMRARRTTTASIAPVQVRHAGLRRRGDTPLDRARLIETAEFLAAHMPIATAPLLDVGCGNGGLLTALAELGFSDWRGSTPRPTARATWSPRVPRDCRERLLGGAVRLADSRVASSVSRCRTFSSTCAPAGRLET